jgi:hypothetical protein
MKEDVSVRQGRVGRLAVLAFGLAASVGLVAPGPAFGQAAPAPSQCNLELSFVDASNRTLARSTVALQPGKAESLELRGRDAVPRGRARASVRAVVAGAADGSETTCRGLAFSVQTIYATGNSGPLQAGSTNGLPCGPGGDGPPPPRHDCPAAQNINAFETLVLNVVLTAPEAAR